MFADKAQVVGVSGSVSSTVTSSCESTPSASMASLATPTGQSVEGHSRMSPAFPGHKKYKWRQVGSTLGFIRWPNKNGHRKSCFSLAF